MKLVFDWAKASGFREGDNPTDGITKVLPKHKDDQQHHAALPYSSVPQFLTTLQTLPTMNEAVRLGLEFLILTATRTNEVQRARWAEIDVETRTWTIPAARMKSSREHRVPLSARALELLEQARALSPNDGWIFPGSKPGKSLSNMTFLKACRRIAADITTHGFRSSFRDWCEEKTTTPRSVAESALAHVVRDQTEAAYRRTDLFERRRKLMDAWAKFATSTPATVTAIGA
jgi:integrase